jgi:septal ring factor EnvC (AmiA/AmiB activator)
MGAARFAAVQAARDPQARQYMIDVAANEARLNEIRDKSARELNAVRHNLTVEIMSLRRELIATRETSESLRSANADLQRRLREQDVTMKSLESTNADLQQKLRGFTNVAKFMTEIARGGSS